MIQQVMSLEQAKLWLQENLAKEPQQKVGKNEKQVEVPFAEYLAKANRERSVK